MGVWRPMSETWEQVLIRAYRAVAAAKAERSRVTRAALDAGLSTRAIGEAVGVPHSTVWRYAGKKGGASGKDLLHAPADTEASR